MGQGGLGHIAVNPKDISWIKVRVLCEFFNSNFANPCLHVCAQEHCHGRTCLNPLDPIQGNCDATRHSKQLCNLFGTFIFLRLRYKKTEESHYPKKLGHCVKSE